MTEHIVELEDIRKRYGDVVALDGVTLRVERGEHVSIIGSSGSGKSTLLRCINNLEVIDHGQVNYVFGSAQEDARHWDAFVNEIFQNEAYAEVLAALYTASVEVE